MTPIRRQAKKLEKAMADAKEKLGEIAVEAEAARAAGS